MFLFLICAMLAGSASEPVESAWILSPRAASPQVRALLPDVHEVIVRDEFVEIHSAGLSLRYLGPFQNPLSADGGLREITFRIPRKPVPAHGETQRIGPGPIGVFLNGVPLYNRFTESSYMGRNLWHFDSVIERDTAHPASLGVLEPMILNGAVHSPLLGFALDGYPIYGPWAFANADGSGGLHRMRSGYKLRKIENRSSWPGGTELTPAQYGPPIGDRFPLGTFAEDFEYVPGWGNLDASNGRFCVTPEYPLGTYAYFLSTDDSNRITFPYFLAGRFRGKLPDALAHQQKPGARVEFAHDTLESGKPAELRFAFPGVSSLEIVHEKPLHLMMVSSDVRVFEHIHPAWKPGAWYSVTHTFSKPGKYRLFAQFTLPGEPERVEKFDVLVTGDKTVTSIQDSLPIEAKLRQPERLQTGEDLRFTVELAGAPIEPYLGAWAHFVFVDKSLNNFIHAHPAESAGRAPDPNQSHLHGLSDLTSGPPPSSIAFTVNFAKPGSYRLWAQFQVAGHPVVIPFTLQVIGSAQVTRAPQPIPAGAVRVTVDARGFAPARIAAKSGEPLTLAITRSTTPNCGSRIVFPSLGIERDLPVGKTTLISLPRLTNDVAFACGMGMNRGVIVAVTQTR